MAREAEKLSTSALARKLEIPAKQLFASLQDFGWVRRHEDNWVLTPHGEFEGGSYQHSKRYGRYIVWPESLAQHKLVAGIESDQRITARGMVRYYPQLHPRQINRALAELGLQQHSILGWELTQLGKSLGGQQQESNSSGAFYVNWPHELVDHPVVHRELSAQAAQLACGKAKEPSEQSAEAPDLFSQPAAPVASELRAIDGHVLDSPLQLQVCNWLYLAQLAHAHRRQLPTEEESVADFYLPEGSIYIDCWEGQDTASTLAARLRRRELYGQLKLRHLEINAADADRLDEVLGRGLLAFGIRR